MSQAKQKRLEQKRAAILASAEEVLIRRGKSATMGDIAQALDMDKSSLYYYFKGIPEILNAILDQEYYDFSLNINRIRKDNKTHVDVLKDVARVILEFYHDNLEILLIILTRIFPLFIEADSQEESTAINNYLGHKSFGYHVTIFPAGTIPTVRNPSHAARSANQSNTPL